MALGLAPATATIILDWLVNGGDPAIRSTIWVELHIGDPGASGTANRAAAGAGIVRKDISNAFSAAAAGAVTNDVEVAWTSGQVTNSEDYSHYSVHSAVTAGTFYWSGLITANAVVAGDQFKILVGDFDLTFALAA